ncbi:hypothetical protein [Evansella tamaricis]|uniref:Uncharacterized protein n=1 Tax=Evansella tamaricis TaxID=2069301 RepID=A0ABS6JE85_9BACI|nr:hypothetical protein [Evansella tamaricis]MBU9711991.1 hypothetical protein [Evansella tamaricis]
MSWSALLKKEWRASSTPFFIGVVGIIVIFSGIYYAMGRYSPFLFLFSYLSIFAHLLAVGLDLLHNLRKEWKENTVYVWLNLPLPGWQLILSKLVITMIEFIITLMITLGFMYVLTNRAIDLFGQRADGQELVAGMEIFKESFVEMIPIILLVIPFVSILLAFGILFIYFMGKSYYRIGWILGTVVVVVSFYGLIKFLDTPVFSVISEWGLIRHFSFPEQIMFEGGSETAIEVGEVLTLPLYAGQIVVGIVLLIAMFSLLSWMLDRKVQVG